MKKVLKSGRMKTMKKLSSRKIWCYTRIKKYRLFDWGVLRTKKMCIEYIK